MFDFLHKKAQDATPPALPEGTVRRRYSIEGQVQGVAFRQGGRRGILCFFMQKIKHLTAPDRRSSAPG